MNRAFVRLSLALSVAAMGLVDLASALLSRPPERLVALRHLVPTGVLDTSRTFTLLAGALLLLTASGLQRGKRRAFVTALFLCAVSVPVNLLKAFDFEEACVATALLFVLGVSGDAFRVKSRAWSPRHLPAPIVALLAAVVVYAIGGCWIVERLYSPANASFARAAQEALYQLTGLGEPTLLVTRDQHVVRWFLHSIGVVGLTLLVAAVLAALAPARHRARHRADRQRVRALLERHGDGSVAAYALAEDTDWFFSENGRAVIAYRFESGVLLAIGDPIGPEEEVQPLLHAFERHCHEHDWTFAFYQCRPERLAHYRARGWKAVHIGEDPVLRPSTFTLEGRARGDVRRSAAKLERAGVQVRHFVPGTNAFDPAQDPDRLLEQMRAVSAAWLRGKSGGEMGFCMGRFEPAALHDVWLSVAWDPARRAVLAFCTWTPVWARRGWALDLMRRADGAPSGVMELLVADGVRHARERGDEVMSLSLSALARVDAASGEPESDRAREFLTERLARFYDFQGLFRWKKKFDPEFEDRYLVYPGAFALPRIALALVRAQNPGGLWSWVRELLPGGADAEAAPQERSPAA
ncbi:MAG: DUF2156 domain-containing protein [Candidatus Eisenbacteria bacterium]|uniref:DUF2156 domain-containing protein n=1 Tax=Eiseniibacteriota bacterium TaxID=2212470 RepID=A0A933W1X7_UNCEI|nr:DUF2156 domain-containing protein [Candidatus Eisenbacteria bacterium]